MSFQRPFLNSMKIWDIKSSLVSHVQCRATIVPATGEAAAGRSIKPKSSRPSLGSVARLHLKKNQKVSLDLIATLQTIQAGQEPGQ